MSSHEDPIGELEAIGVGILLCVLAGPLAVLISLATWALWRLTAG